MRFAVALASTTQLHCAVNAGQWQANTPSAMTGWAVAAVELAAPVRIADRDYLSAAGDAEPHARYEDLLDSAQLITVHEIGFWPWSGTPPMQGGAAQINVIDPDGKLDALAQQDLSGLAVSIRLGQIDGSVAASAPVARYVVDRLEVQDDSTKVLYLRDAHEDLDELLTRGVFLPNIPALAWKIQPVVIGAVASVPGLVTNSDGTSLWLADAPLASLGDVMDRGDVLEAGTYELAPNAQQVNTYSPTLGPVVADVSTIGPNQQPATLQQALTEIFRRIRKTAWSAGDASTLDAITGYAGIGYYAGQDTTIRAALAAILPSYGAWFWQDPTGVLHFTRVIDPDSVADEDLAFDIDEAELLNDAGLQVLPDNAPNLTRRMAYRPNAQALGSGDLVTDLVDVPPARRNELTSLWRGQVFSAGTLAARYAAANNADPMVSCFWAAADAQAEIDRVTALYAVERRFFVPPALRGRDYTRIQPGQVGRIRYNRYGIAAGKKVLVKRVETNHATADVKLILWG